MKTQSSPYQNLTANYTPGYVWPYLHLPHYGIPERQSNLNAFVTWLQNGFLDNGWRLYREKLLHELLRAIEKKKGLLRGHLLVEFEASPTLSLLECTCDHCGIQVTEVVNDPTAGAGSSSAYLNRSCSDQHCQGTFRATERRQIPMPLPAVGVALGACWLFTPREAAVWAHEIGHHRHLEHARGRQGPQPAPGAKPNQHDVAVNPHHQTQAHAHNRGWNRFCIMSYDRSSPQAFCGKCLLRNRGWAVESMPCPQGNLEDP
ncbi:MAG: hypothetical protein ACP5U2_02675 [Bryobacteraceae bacterium]